MVGERSEVAGRRDSRASSLQRLATHPHQAGAAASDLQAVLGHTKLDKTMGYLEGRPGNVRSPLDSL